MGGGPWFPILPRPTPLLDRARAMSVDEKWTSVLRDRYAKLRSIHPDLYDFDSSQIYVDHHFGTVKVGNSRLYFTRRSDEVMEVNDIYVEPTQRGMGLGRLLVEVGLGLMRDLGVKEVILDGPVEDPAFWTRMGFSPGPDQIWRRKL